MACCGLASKHHVYSFKTTRLICRIEFWPSDFMLSAIIAKRGFWYLVPGLWFISSRYSFIELGEPIPASNQKQETSN
jgi:hypothetical protein